MFVKALFQFFWVISIAADKGITDWVILVINDMPNQAQWFCFPSSIFAIDIRSNFFGPGRARIKRMKMIHIRVFSTFLLWLSEI